MNNRLAAKGKVTFLLPRDRVSVALGWLFGPIDTLQPTLRTYLDVGKPGISPILFVDLFIGLVIGKLDSSSC